MPPRKVQIIRYSCEHCGATHTSEAGIRSEGMCACGYPMRIDELFSDRRIAMLPVAFDRRGAHAV